jgi:hypothetical protein
MGELLSLRNPQDYVWAMKRIRHLWEEGKVELVSHAIKQMAKRHIDMLDIQHVIRYGRIVSHSMPLYLWRYKVAGTRVNGRPVACIVEINGNLIIVTVVATRRR